MIVTINNLKINCSFEENVSSDEFVLFLHGWGGSIASFKGLQKALKDYNTINIDLCGFGKSDSPPANFTVYDYAEIVLGVLNKLEIQKVTIIAHSFGGRLAIILASLRKDIVKKLVLIDSAGLKPKFNFITYMKIKKYKFYKFLVNKKLIKKSILEKFGSNDYKALDKINKMVFNNIVTTNLDFLVSNIKCPTLLLWGKEDSDTPLYMAKILNKKIKNSGLVVFNNAGHYSYLDEPKKTLLILKNFLENKE